MNFIKKYVVLINTKINKNSSHLKKIIKILIFLSKIKKLNLIQKFLSNIFLIAKAIKNSPFFYRTSKQHQKIFGEKNIKERERKRRFGCNFTDCVISWPLTRSLLTKKAHMFEFWVREIYCTKKRDDDNHR